MLAASYWSLLAPAIGMAEDSGKYGSFAFLPVAVGFALGAAFVYFADLAMPLLVSASSRALNVADACRCAYLKEKHAIYAQAENWKYTQREHLLFKEKREHLLFKEISSSETEKAKPPFFMIWYISIKYPRTSHNFHSNLSAWKMSESLKNYWTIPTWTVELLKLSLSWDVDLQVTLTCTVKASVTIYFGGKKISK